MRTVIVWRLGLVCHGQNSDYLSHVLQHARGATNNTKIYKNENYIQCTLFSSLLFVNDFCLTTVVFINVVVMYVFINCSVTSNVGAGDQKPDYEFNVWTKPDCAGTSYENRNRCCQNHHIFLI